MCQGFVPEGERQTRNWGCQRSGHHQKKNRTDGLLKQMPRVPLTHSLWKEQAGEGLPALEAEARPALYTPSPGPDGEERDPLAPVHSGSAGHSSAAWSPRYSIAQVLTYLLAFPFVSPTRCSVSRGPSLPGDLLRFSFHRQSFGAQVPIKVKFHWCVALSSPPPAELFFA